MPGKPKPPTQFKIYAIGQHICDSASAEALMGGRHTAAKITSHQADGIIDLTITHIYLPHIHLWRSHTLGPINIELPSKADSQIFYFPGQGEVDIYDCNVTLTCDETFGVTAEIPSVKGIRIDKERLGIGLTVSRSAMAKYLSKRLDGALHSPITFEARFRADTPEIMGMAQMLDAILDASGAATLFHANDTAEAISTGVISLLLDHVPNNYKLALERHRNAAPPAYVARAVLLMNQAPDASALTVEDVANACGVSVRKLQYGFSEHRGESPIAHLRGLRLQQARKMISGGSPLSLLQIAQSTGFSNYARFSKQYRKAFGETPSQTRSGSGLQS
ncbi:hypothetical protein DDF62_22405 [Caulobacter radicis]|uniref:AraC family transcriptional regulator n=1 Tax=Caulobacter radicis TaxID=2172650 RepID=UPI000D563CBF|nr:AraC family transcriptional regulator [Caulobacter radicis]PVM84485.1 hypothetical protein DDF62_22405 [Caulobacter radicis]